MSATLRKVLPARIESVPVGSGEGDELPARGGTVQRAYARTHYLLRYHLGAAVDLPGPRTAFVAARRTDEGVPS